MNTQVVNGSVIHPAVAAVQETTGPQLYINIPKSEWDALLAERDQSQVQVRELRAAAEAESQRWEGILDDANDWADRHDLCERYDEFLESKGLPTRVNDYDSTVTVELNINLITQGRDSEAAASEVSLDMIADCLGDMSRAELYSALSDYTVSETERA